MYSTRLEGRGFGIGRSKSVSDRSNYESSYEYSLDVNIPGEAGTGILV